MVSSYETPIPFVPAKHFQPAHRTKVDLIVIHTAECSESPSGAHNVAVYFASPNAPEASAHYVVDGTGVIQCVLEKDIAWHATKANPFSIGVEHAGFARQSSAEWQDAYSQREIYNSANLVGAICLRWDIPIVRLTPIEVRAGARGICGHVDVNAALEGGKGHVDPGLHFPWDEYIAIARAGAIPSSPDGAA